MINLFTVKSSPGGRAPAAPNNKTAVNRYIQPVIILMLLCAACTSAINQFAFYPDRDYTCPLPAYAGEVILETVDGIKLQAIIYRGKKQGSSIVIYFHGNAGNLYHRTAEAEKLLGTGCDVVVSGYRGYGRSTGKPSEEGIYIDGACVLDYVHRVLGYPYEKIFIYGRSLGTAVAVHTGAGIPLAGMILVTPLSSAEDFARDRVSDYSASYVKKDFRTIDKINKLTCPLLVIHGTADEVIPYSHGLKIFGAYNGTKQMVTITGGRHNDLEFTDPVLYWSSVRDFLAR